MRLSLEDVRRIANDHHVEPFPDGFRLTGDGQDTDRFSRLVASIVESSGEDFVALPLTDGRHGYEGVVIIPLPPLL
jgi:hypothetical protein